MRRFAWLGSLFHRSPERRLERQRLWTPARMMLASYLTVIALGTVGLKLPAASAGPALGWIDALFTSTSAVCVTGLIVVDTATHFTRLGQWIILVLIQLGGLGILTFTTWILILAGQGISGFHRTTSVSSYGSLQTIYWYEIIRNVFVYTFLLEVFGFLVLWGWWHGDYATPGEGAFQSFFHAVSAFCNAGFSTLEGGALRYVADPVVNVVFGVLIITGGLGFIVLSDVVRRYSKGSPSSRLSLHSRVALRMTALLLVLGMVAILLLEWGHSLAPHGVAVKILASFFQSMTTRTAGFNTLEIADLTAATLLVIILLMVIGASPGSTGGGIKTTTFAILLALMRSQTYGRRSVELRRRRIPAGDVARALATIAMYCLTLFVGFMALLVVEKQGGSAAMVHDQFLDILFETVSALSTVGLSMGYTSDLTPAGRLIVTVLMVCGRLGPIVVVVGLFGERPHLNYEFAEESVLTG